MKGVLVCVRVARARARQKAIILETFLVRACAPRARSPGPISPRGPLSKEMLGADGTLISCQLVKVLLDHTWLLLWYWCWM